MGYDMIEEQTDKLLRYLGKYRCNHDNKISEWLDSKDFEPELKLKILIKAIVRLL